MKKKLFFAAVALVALASCSSDEYLGDQQLRKANENAVITMSLNVPTPTRGANDKSGSAAAGDLNNQFIIYGEKNESNFQAPTDGNLVFPNYQVNYGTSTAYTTQSNTKDWEYVGYTHSAKYQTNITTKDGSNAAKSALDEAQTIKYWDYGASSYTFTAVAATGIENDYIKIQKNTSSDANHGFYGKGYTITVDENADLGKLYFSDREVVSQSNNTDRTQTNKYGGNVTLTFRNVLSWVRVGIYETIPGYYINNITFYQFNANDGELTLEAKNTNSESCFGAKCPNIKGQGYSGTLDVVYGAAGDILNQPIVTASGTPNSSLILGTNINTSITSSYMKTTSADPTWDTSGGDFTAVMPQITNSTNLKLKCDFTLYNDKTKETIEVIGATAEIPAQYLQWKPNYKYTYLFKISDNTNGSTGQNIPGLYPITFDAIEVVAQDGQAEYITTVSEPSITTFGYDATNKKYITGSNEYPAGCDIYATFMEGSTVKTPIKGGSGAQHVNVYFVTTSDAANYPITEASVAESLANPTNNKITCVANNSTSTDIFTAAPEVVSTVPGEDGVNITIDALKLTGVKATTATSAYAIEYEASDAWTGSYKKVYKIIKVQ